MAQLEFKPGSQSKFVLLSLTLLCACSSLPEIDTTRLEKRLRIDVDVRIAEWALIYSDAKTRNEGAKATAGDAAGTAINAANNELGLVLLPVTLPVAAIMGAGWGAATGSDETRKSIDAAVSQLQRSFRPNLFEANAEKSLADELKASIFSDDRYCIISTNYKSNCLRGVSKANLIVDMGFSVVPARRDARSGQLDFIGSVTVLAEPRGVLLPECISWTFRRPAGNLFELTKDESLLLKKEFSSFLREVTLRLPKELFVRQAKTESNSIKWMRTGCKVSGR